MILNKKKKIESIIENNWLISNEKFHPVKRKSLTFFNGAFIPLKNLEMAYWRGSCKKREVFNGFKSWEALNRHKIFNQLDNFIGVLQI